MTIDEAIEFYKGYDERVKENWCSCSVCAFGFGWKRTIHYKYCPDCEQKLDWSVTNE